MPPRETSSHFAARWSSSPATPVPPRRSAGSCSSAARHEAALERARERRRRLRRGRAGGPREAALLGRAADDLPELGEASTALAAGDHERGLEKLEAALGTAQDETRELIRKAMVGVFAELGADHPLSREYRRKLAAALY